MSLQPDRKFSQSLRELQDFNGCVSWAAVALEGGRSSSNRKGAGLNPGSLCCMSSKILNSKLLPVSSWHIAASV